MVDTRSTEERINNLELNTTLMNLQRSIDKINKNINGWLIFQQMATSDIKSLNSGDGCNNTGSLSQYTLMEELQKLTKVNRGTYQIDQFSHYNLSNMSCNLHVVNGLRPFLASECTEKVISGNTMDESGTSDESSNNAYVLFDEMSSTINLKQNGSIREYYEAFNSLISKITSLNESEIVNCFVGGLQPEIGKRVEIYKPRTLYDAYCLATMEETASNLIKKRFSPTLLKSQWVKNASDIENTDKMASLGKSGKEGGKSEEIESFDYTSPVLRKRNKEEYDHVNEGEIGSSETERSRGLDDVGDLKPGIHVHLNQLRVDMVRNKGLNDNSEEPQFKEKAADISPLLLPSSNLKDSNDVNNGIGGLVNTDKSTEGVNNYCLDLLPSSMLCTASDKGNKNES